MEYNFKLITAPTLSSVIQRNSRNSGYSLSLIPGMIWVYCKLKHLNICSNLKSGQTPVLIPGCDPGTTWCTWRQVYMVVVVVGGYAAPTYQEARSTSAAKWLMRADCRLERAFVMQMHFVQVLMLKVSSFFFQNKFRNASATLVLSLSLFNYFNYSSFICSIFFTL